MSLIGADVCCLSGELYQLQGQWVHIRAAQTDILLLLAAN